jgi:hypothetical protein
MELAGSAHKVDQITKGLERNSRHFVALGAAFAPKMKQSDGALSEFETTFCGENVIQAIPKGRIDAKPLI